MYHSFVYVSKKMFNIDFAGRPNIDIENQIVAQYTGFYNIKVMRTVI